MLANLYSVSSDLFGFHGKVRMDIETSSRSTPGLASRTLTGRRVRRRCFIACGRQVNGAAMLVPGHPTIGTASSNRVPATTVMRRDRRLALSGGVDRRDLRDARR
jgi:hypothetical protein